jgi:hypothetical protein
MGAEDMYTMGFGRPSLPLVGDIRDRDGAADIAKKIKEEGGERRWTKD